MPGQSLPYRNVNPAFCIDLGFINSTIQGPIQFQQVMPQQPPMLK